MYSFSFRFIFFHVGLVSAFNILWYVSLSFLQRFWCFPDHYHHVVLVARISLTLSRHFSQSFIASGRSSGLHPVSSQSCWMYVRAGRPAFARPYVGVHKSTSLMSSSLLLHCFPDTTVVFFLLFLFSHFSLSTWHIFKCQIPFPYTGFIFLICIS